MTMNERIEVYNLYENRVVGDSATIFHIDWYLQKNSDKGQDDLKR